MANLVAIVAVSSLVVTGLIIAGVLITFKSPAEDPISPIPPEIKIVQNKCKEYARLACTFEYFPGRIMDGELVNLGVLPHQAFMYMPLKGNDTVYMICGGSLISEKFILTAAHCVREMDQNKSRILLGSVDRNTPKNSKQWKKIKKIYQHPGYYGENFHNDICLIELEEEVEFNSDVRPICLNTKLKENYDTMVVSGWGRTEDGENSRYLKMVTLKANKQSEEHCQKHFQVENNILQDMLICFSHCKAGCNKGDSGGPLQIPLENSCKNVWEQIGIVSHISSSVFKGEEVKQAYIRVAYYIPWIVGIVWPN